MGWVSTTGISEEAPSKNQGLQRLRQAKFDELRI
jgi:hypothetical protein